MLPSVRFLTIYWGCCIFLEIAGWAIAKLALGGTDFADAVLDAVYTVAFIVFIILCLTLGEKRLNRIEESIKKLDERIPVVSLHAFRNDGPISADGEAEQSTDTTENGLDDVRL